MNEGELLNEFHVTYIRNVFGIFIELEKLFEQDIVSINSTSYDSLSKFRLCLVISRSVRQCSRSVCLNLGYV